MAAAPPAGSDSAGSDLAGSNSAGSKSAGSILVIGASLEAERIVHLVRQLPDSPTILGFLTVDETTESVGATLCELPVVAKLENLGSYADRIVGAVPAAENPFDRETILAALVRADIPALSLVHPKANLGAEVDIATGAVIHAGATLEMGVRVGRGAVVGAGVTVGARTRIGDYVEVAQGCVLGTNVRLGERARIGLGARITDGILIGPDAAVGAGSLVTRDVVGASAVIGNPAEPVVRRSHPEVDNA